MPTTTEKVQSLITTLLAGREAHPSLELVDYLNAIPRLDSLASVPSGTPVLIRGDVDARRHPSPLDGRHTQVRYRARLEANYLRPHRPRAREVAQQSRRPLERNPRPTCRTHHRLVRPNLSNSSPTGSTPRPHAQNPSPGNAKYACSTIALAMSAKKAPTIGISRNASGAGPWRRVRVCITDIATAVVASPAAT